MMTVSVANATKASAQQFVGCCLFFAQHWHNNRNGNQMNRRPLALTDHQLAEVQHAAHSLLPSQRERFLEGLARRLGDEPSDEALREAIAAQLALNRIPTFLCG
jgi:hypothetical protein